MRWLIVAVAVTLAAGAGGAYLAMNALDAPGPLAEPQNVMVPRGGLDQVGDALAQAGVIRSRRLFQFGALVSWAEGPIHAGELSFPPEASVSAVLSVLRHGRPVQHRVTIPEGLTAAQISRILAGADGLEGDLTVPREGAVFPDTYSFERGTAPDEVVARADAAMHRAVAAAWAAREAGLPLASPQEAVVLASIVEREARLPVERPMIARVFLNRLAAHMRLQADPTSAYGASGGLGTMGRELEHGDLEQVNPYNTYVIDGLPAGPICSPGLASIRAVLHPSSGSALYFVADGTGGHVFANSLTDHNSNVSRQRARVRKR